MKPTIESYLPFQNAYDFFNERLFESELPACLITFQRQKRIMGYVSLERWVNSEREYTHELAINPEYFANFPLIEICQTLCHEMVHIWQSHFGNPGRHGYHNMEWAKKMISIGLMPSSTGEPGGEIIGQPMMDYIVEDGRFKLAFDELIASGFQLTWIDRYPVIRDVKKTFVYTRDGSPADSNTLLPNSPILDSMNQDTAAIHSVPYSIAELEAAFNETYFSQSLQPRPLISTTRPRHSSNKHKYRCPKCHMQLWGKRDLLVICGECHETLIESS